MDVNHLAQLFSLNITALQVGTGSTAEVTAALVLCETPLFLMFVAPEEKQTHMYQQRYQQRYCGGNFHLVYSSFNFVHLICHLQYI